jgi:uncharacterized protein YxeA
MSPTAATKTVVLAVLILILAAIFADLTLISRTESGKEDASAKQALSEAKKEAPATEEKNVQPQVEVNWKNKFQRYTYGGEGEESENKLREEEEDKLFPPNSGD